MLLCIATHPVLQQLLDHFFPERWSYMLQCCRAGLLGVLCPFSEKYRHCTLFTTDTENNLTYYSNASVLRG